MLLPWTWRSKGMPQNFLRRASFWRSQAHSPWPVTTLLQRLGQLLVAEGSVITLHHATCGVATFIQKWAGSLAWSGCAVRHPTVAKSSPPCPDHHTHQGEASRDTDRNRVIISWLPGRVRLCAAPRLWHPDTRNNAVRYGDALPTRYDRQVVQSDDPRRVGDVRADTDIVIATRHTLPVLRRYSLTLTLPGRNGSLRNCVPKRPD